MSFTRQNIVHRRIKLPDKKIKILTLGDHPLLPSGVGTQSRYVFEALLKSGKFKIISLGGAIKHPSYDPVRTQEYGEDWTIYPVDGYGDETTIRKILMNERPDILWFMTDPRFYQWLAVMDDEIRMNIPMVYYHVWDNKPYPLYNEPFYSSIDMIATISKVTSEIVQNVSPGVWEEYIPHAVDTKVFRKLTSPEEKQVLENHRQQILRDGKDKTIFFWNNRNARRKQSGTLIFWFKEFLDRVGHDQAILVMHTDPEDPHGQPLPHLITVLELVNGQVQLSTQKISPDGLNLFYNAADCTINISDAEGFGLATLESMAAETPIIVNMTGGLQDQVTDGENWFGIGITPSSKSIIGSQAVPYIYEDRINKDEFLNALEKIHKMSKKDREALGKKCRKNVEERFNFENFKNRWVDLMLEVHEKFGSWDTRKNYDRWGVTKL